MNTKVGTSAYNAAIAACGHAGSADEALPLLKEMDERGVPRSVITYRYAGNDNRHGSFRFPLRPGTRASYQAAAARV